MKNRNLSLKFLLFCGIFTFGNAYSQDYKGIIENYLATANSGQFSKTDLKTFEISNKDFSKSLNSEIVKTQQTFNGIPVFGSVATALIKDGKVLNYTENFVKNYDSNSTAKASLSDAVVFQKIAQKFNLNATDYQLDEIISDKNENAKTAKRRLVYFKNNQKLTLCYEFFFEEIGTSNYWNVLADANTGEILNQENLTVSCNFNHDAFSHTYADHLPQVVKDFVENNVEVSTKAPGTATYNVFAFPLEAPSFGSRTLLTNPWFLDASPEGWQSTGTLTYTNTRGNNVFAYNDHKGNNTVQGSPDGGTAGIFDFPYAANATANQNLDAAITNLFYINNKMHDIFYRFGFNEQARNFQGNNFGKGGAQNDYVLAEAQDGSGENNANFGTPIDGSRPRMQMYLWDSGKTQEIKRLYYNTPPAAVPRYAVNYDAQFGTPLNDVGVTANVALSPVLDACTALPAGSLANLIGLIERGTCSFVIKVKNAQDAGAKGVIVYNAASSPALTGPMGGTDATVTIPSIVIENSEGEYIKSLLSAATPVNVTLKFNKFDINYLDGSFDNGIVAHEYGHGISNRNTGDGYSCLSQNNSNEQMGEGWSDFFALMLTNQPGATAAVARGIGTYAVGQPNSGIGLRPKKYSPNFAVNNTTYNYTNGKTYVNDSGTTVVDVHTVGFVWATMLWDLHWNFADKYGYASDVATNPTSGSAKVLQLVVDGLKLQPCSPTFIDGRDAILAADAAKGGTDRCIIWNTFAKRGLGLNASAGSKVGVGAAMTDQVEDFTVPTDCKLATNEVSNDRAISIYPNPAKNEFFVKIPSQQLGKLSVEVYDAAGKLVTSDKVSGSESISTTKLQNGVYIVKVKGLGVESSSKLIIKK